MGSGRREEIFQVLQTQGGPVTGSDLAKRFQVSRQVIVQDIALLRARGLDIIATPQGYLYGRQAGSVAVTRRIACRHTPGQARAELEAIVTAGCRIIDVIVEHPIYGEIRGYLRLASTQDVDQFIEVCAENDAQLLSTLTAGVHLHTIQADGLGDLQRAVEELRKQGIVLEELD